MNPKQPLALPQYSSVPDFTMRPQTVLRKSEPGWMVPEGLWPDKEPQIILKKGNKLYDKQLLESNRYLSDIHEAD